MDDPRMERATLHLTNSSAHAEEAFFCSRQENDDGSVSEEHGGWQLVSFRDLPRSRRRYGTYFQTFWDALLNYLGLHIPVYRCACSRSGNKMVDDDDLRD